MDTMAIFQMKKLRFSQRELVMELELETPKESSRLSTMAFILAHPLPRRVFAQVFTAYSIPPFRCWF